MVAKVTVPFWASAVRRWRGCWVLSRRPRPPPVPLAWRAARARLLPSLVWVCVAVAVRGPAGRAGPSFGGPAGSARGGGVWACVGIILGDLGSWRIWLGRRMGSPRVQLRAPVSGPASSAELLGAPRPWGVPGPLGFPPALAPGGAFLGGGRRGGAGGATGFLRWPAWRLGV